MSADSSRERIPGVPRYKRDKSLPMGTEPFFPNFLLKEWIMGAVFIAGFMVWVIFNPVDLTPRANPDDTAFIPVPDWYFLFLYQLLKYYPGPVLAVGTVAVPTVSILALMLAPWLDIQKNRRPFKRMATWAMVVTVIFMAWLTREAEVAYQMELAANPAAQAELKAGSSNDTGGSGSDSSATAVIAKPDDPGAKLFASNCAACHGADLKGGFGPKLLGIGNQFPDEQKLLEYVQNPKPIPGVSATGMPKSGNVKDPEKLKQIVHWLAQQKQK